MVSYFVRYRGSSSDPDGFSPYYETRHAPILGRFPNIRSLILHSPSEWADPFPVRRADSFLLAQMVFDSAGDLDAALRSPARGAGACDDFQRFPPFDGDVTHEAMAGKVIF
jgi:uncharacterized protein (TIGR02118 family)